MPLRVYYEDTDAAGIVYHANYLKFAERGRTEMLRELGFEHSASREESGTLFTVRRCSIDYLAPARLDDALTVDTRVVEIGGRHAAARSADPARRGDPGPSSTCWSPASGARAGRAACRAGLRAALITLPS